MNDVKKSPTWGYYFILIIWFIIITLIVTAQPSLATSEQMKGWEDYTSEISQLHFGDNLRAEQLYTELVYSRAKAIAIHEGFYREGSLAQRNNNPGNLKKSGYPRDRQGHSIFPTVTHGWLELYALLYRHNDESLEQMNKWYATDKSWSKGVRKIMLSLN